LKDCKKNGAWSGDRDKQSFQMSTINYRMNIVTQPHMIKSDFRCFFAN
jgi:hypothetical protein